MEAVKFEQFLRGWVGLGWVGVGRGWGAGGARAWGGGLGLAAQNLLLLLCVAICNH